MRLNSTLQKLDSPFNRPSQPLYQGQSHILVGLCLGLEKPVTLAVWDANQGKILVYRNVRQLLGKDHLLLNQQRQQQRINSHQRHKAQKQSAPNQFGPANLGLYIDRLLAKAIIAIAQEYQAGNITIPSLTGIRERLNAEVQAKAEQKIPGYLEGQKRYIKQYCQAIHQWSHRRLIDQISSQAAQAAIAIEEAEQTYTGTFQEKAREVAIAAYTNQSPTLVNVV